VTARERLAARRKLVGLSQEDLGEALGVHPQTVAAWEQGRATPRPWYRTLLADALRVDMEEVECLLAPERGAGTPRAAPVLSMATEWGVGSAARLADATAGDERALVGVDAAVRLVHEWLVVEPPQSVELRAGRRVGARLAVATAERVDRLRHLDDYLAGADLEAAVGRELAVTSAVVRDASYSDAVGRQLLGTLGDLCQLAGSMAGRCYVELGLPRRAIPILEQSVAAYDEERPREAALYLSWLAEAHIQAGDVEHAAALAGQVLDLTHRTASARTVERLRHLCGVLRPHRGGPGVGEFLERARAL
jgi:transcriptional regulator with XRE-family HTH domain